MDPGLAIISATVISGFSALYSYIQSKKLKKVEAKINVGEKQLEKILSESDDQIKYIYRLQHLCNEFRQILSGLYNRQYERRLDNKATQLNFYFINNPFTLELFNKLNNTLPAEWPTKFANEFQGAIKPWEWTESYTIIENNDILMLLFIFSKIIAWMEIKKKDDSTVHAYSSQRGKINQLLTRFTYILNTENDRKISIPLISQKEIGANMIEQERDASNLYRSIDYLDFKDKLFMTNGLSTDNDKIHNYTLKHKEANENSSYLTELSTIENQLRELITTNFPTIPLNLYNISVGVTPNSMPNSMPHSMSKEIRWKINNNYRRVNTTSNNSINDIGNILPNATLVDFSNYVNQAFNITDQRKYLKYEADYLKLLNTNSASHIYMNDVKFIFFDNHQYEQDEIYNFAMIGDSDRQKKLERDLRLLKCFNSGQVTIFDQFIKIFAGSDKIREFLKRDEPEPEPEPIYKRWSSLRFNNEPSIQDPLTGNNSTEIPVETSTDTTSDSPIDLDSLLNISLAIQQSTIPPQVELVGIEAVDDITTPNNDETTNAISHETYLYDHYDYFMDLFDATICYYYENIYKKEKCKFLNCINCLNFKSYNNTRKAKVAFSWGKLVYRVEKFVQHGDFAVEQLFDLQPSPAIGKKGKLSNIPPESIDLATKWLDFFITKISQFQEFNNYSISYYKSKFKNEVNDINEDNPMSKPKKECFEIFKDIFYEFIFRSKYNTLNKLDRVMEELIEETEKLINEDIKKRQDLLNG